LGRILVAREIDIRAIRLVCRSAEIGRYGSRRRERQNGSDGNSRVFSHGNAIENERVPSRVQNAGNDIDIEARRYSRQINLLIDS